MRSPVILSGDEVRILKVFGNRMVFTEIFDPTIDALTRVHVTGNIRGSGHARVSGKKMCVLGDEKKVSLTGLYIVPGCVTPGIGKVTITALDEDQVTPWCASDAPLITQGALFTLFKCRFTPTVPAMMPGVPPIPDPGASLPTSGFGLFRPSQRWVRVG